MLIESVLSKDIVKNANIDFHQRKKYKIKITLRKPKGCAFLFICFGLI